jgi:small subunit ribosomal protein S16
VAVKIKLKRLGKIHAPQYRIVVADSRTARNGRAIEEIGTYQPMADPSIITVNSDRVQYWLGVGAQPTEPVMAILKVTGDWQKFKGLPGAEGTLRVAEVAIDKRVVFAAAVEDAVVAADEKWEPPVKVEAVEEVAADEAVVEEAEAIVESAVVEEVVAEAVAEEVVADAVAEEAVVEAVVEEAAAEAVAESTES